MRREGGGRRRGRKEEGRSRKKKQNHHLRGEEKLYNSTGFNSVLWFGGNIPSVLQPRTRRGTKNTVFLPFGGSEHTWA